jgi:hypothetical protein
LARRFLLANSYKCLRPAHGTAPSGYGASCHGQLSRGAIEVLFRSHRAVFRIWFDKKIFLDRTGFTRDQTEHIFDNHYKDKSGIIASRDFNDQDSEASLI